jgi:hypothetical protein
MYFWIQNSEDGLRVIPISQIGELLDRIEEETCEDIRPECCIVFIETIPDEYTDTNKVCIIQGAVRIPEPVTTVTQWAI